MSFNINGPENIPAIQKSHHTNDGGAGNLGYFQQQKKKKENEKETKDVFEISSKSEEEEEELTVEDFKDKIKNFWLKFKIHKHEE